MSIGSFGFYKKFKNMTSEESEAIFQLVKKFRFDIFSGDMCVGKIPFVAQACPCGVRVGRQQGDYL